jgi:cytochrome P450
MSADRPSPLFLGINHLWRIRRDQLSFYADLQRRHGDAVRLRLGPYRLWYIFHPDLIEPVLTRHAHAFIRFRKLMDVLRQWNGDSLLLAEGQAWRERRRKVLPALSTRLLPVYGHAVVAETRTLSEQLQSSANADGLVAFDADAVMARLTLNIAVRTLFGAAPSDEGPIVEAALQDLSVIAFAESTTPLKLPDWLPIRAKRRKRHAMRVMDGFVGGLVRDALNPATTERGALVASLIEHHEHRFDAIRDDAMSLLIAGHETSGALLSWTWAALAVHREWLGRVLEEIDGVLRCEEATTAHLMRLPVVRAVLNETLRLYPPAYTLFLREAVSDVPLKGVTIRRGDLVQIVPFITQRDPRFFAQPEAFDPGRFLGEVDWPAYAYLPFGAGPRVCIGQNFGLMETALALATMLQHFAPEPLAAMPEPAARYSLRPADGLPMTWRRR